MGIQFVPPWGQELGQSLGKIATGVRDTIDPEAEMRKQLEQHLISNPEFAQSLADREYVNPGAITQNMKKFFSRDASGLISSLAPSMNARMERVIRDNADLIREDPTLAQDIIARAATGRTAAQRKIENVQSNAVDQYTNSPDFQNDLPEAGASVAFPGMVRARTQREVNLSRIRDADLRTEATNALRLEIAQGGWQNAQTVAGIYAAMQRDRDFARFSSDDRSTVNGLMNSINTLQNQFDAPNSNEETRNSTIAGINRNIAQVNMILRNYGQQPISATVTEGRSNVAGMQIPGIGRKKLVYTQGGDPIDINQFSTQLMNAVIPSNGGGSVGHEHTVRGPGALPGANPNPASASVSDAGKLRAQAELIKRNTRITDAQLTTAGWSTDDIARIRRLANVPAPR